MFFSSSPFKLSVMLVLPEVGEGPYYYGDWFFCLIPFYIKDGCSDIRFERLVV